MISKLEIWKDIIGYEGYYKISNIGNVRRIYPPKINSNGKWVYIGNNLTKNFRGLYHHIYVCKNGTENNLSIHRLVAKAFIPNPENKPQVNHIDGNKLNNNVENLEWCTASENHKHAFKTGLRTMPSGDENWNSKLNNMQVRVIAHLKNIKPKTTQKNISNIFNINQSIISRIWSKNIKSNITSNI